MWIALHTKEWGATIILAGAPRRYWRSRADPFIDVWDTEIVPLLKNAPKLMAITLLRKLQDDDPERFPDGMLRTLQRHVRHWRALEGPSKEAFFPQDHAPGHRGLSDFTARVCSTTTAWPARATTGA